MKGKAPTYTYTAPASYTAPMTGKAPTYTYTAPASYTAPMTGQVTEENWEENHYPTMENWEETYDYGGIYDDMDDVIDEPIYLEEKHSDDMEFKKKPVKTTGPEGKPNTSEIAEKKE